MVTVYNTAWPPELRVALTSAFKEKHGIDVQFVPFARGEELVVRFEAEKRANLHLADAFGAGATSILGTLKTNDNLGPIEPFLILPEVMDANMWNGARFPFVDRDKLAIGMAVSVNRYILYNTDLVRDGEIATFKDVLRPQYRGKITINDPTVTGAGQGFVNHLIHDLWNFEEFKDFLRQLIRQQEVVIQRDNRLHAESVARGKFAIGLAPHLPTTLGFMNMGAPVKFVINKEGSFVTYGSGVIAVPKKLAHPNATAVFINWLLSRDGQTAFSRAFGLPSVRTDVPTDGLQPVFIPQQGEKLFWLTEERVVLMDEWLGIAKKVVEEAGK
ncbi:MAG: extracellular solute-binding protein [Chloroflexi bacterium]|nr:extracellular solute-binding protein [Chloroflexota bacterium]